MRQGLELLPMQVPVQARTRLASIVERVLASPLEGAGRRDTDERAVERTARERVADPPVGARREEQRQRRRALAQVHTRDLAGLDGLTGALEDVVGDLKRDSEPEPEPADCGRHVPVPVGPEQARGLEELPGLEGAALEVALDRRLGV